MQREGQGHSIQPTELVNQIYLRLIDHAWGPRGVHFTSLRAGDWQAAGSPGLGLGLTDDEASEALAISLRTLQRGWRNARRWLFERLDPEDACRAAP